MLCQDLKPKIGPKPMKLTRRDLEAVIGMSQTSCCSINPSPPSAGVSLTRPEQVRPAQHQTFRPGSGKPTDIVRIPSLGV